MPLVSKGNTPGFERKLYGGVAGWLQSVRLHKRGDDQQQGTVTAHVLHDCRRSAVSKTGETIQGDMVADHRTTWHIPRDELDRVGVLYLNATDKIEQLEGDEAGDFWHPEATTEIRLKLDGLHYCIDCLRVDPPAG